MFNFKNRIISWYYRYTDNLIRSRVLININKDTDQLSNAAFFINKFDFLAINILIILISSFFIHFIPDNIRHYVRYLFIGYLYTIILIILISFIKYIINAIRKRSFISLMIMFIACLFTACIVYLTQLLEKYHYDDVVIQFIIYIVFFAFFSIMYLGRQFVIKIIKKYQQLKNKNV